MLVRRLDGVLLWSMSHAMTMSRARKDGQTGMSTHIVISATIPIASTSTNQWPCLTLRLLWRVARAVLKEYPGVLRTRLHPPTPVGLQHEQSKNNALVYWGTRLHSDSCGSVARAVPSVLTGGACRTKVVPLW
ncbi:hypothetical protein NDU88_003177 [Pleurodeles waltl]|uniref:Secreted protein n=1 Tax=Pleurodeles waltl TaxID=8319 RepID=A0AAV7UD09_PLEWA|nr:hypothetical protein NDU88_003177 [Pleurodeles waltl]